MNRRMISVLAGGLSTALLMLSSASACVGGPILQVTPNEVKAGGEVTLTGISFDADLPLVVRFNALDGPVLGTFKIGEDRALPASKVRLPAGTGPGNYVLVGTQPSSSGGQAVVPTRALVIVVGEGGRPITGAPVLGEETGRPTGLAEEERSVSAGALALVGLGVFGLALLIAGGAAALSAGRRPQEASARRA